MDVWQNDTTTSTTGCAPRVGRRRTRAALTAGVTLMAGALGTVANAVPVPAAAPAVARAAAGDTLRGSVAADTVRVSGQDRVATALAVSRRAFPGTAASVYLVPADNPVDALAAGTLTDGPTLLVPRTGVPAAVKDEIARLSPRTVVALGGTAVLPDAVLDAAAGTRESLRLAGDNRYQTAALVSRRSFPTTAARVYLANSTAYADAGTAGALTDGPILLVPAKGPIPAATLTEIARLAPQNVTALGGTGVIPEVTLKAAARGRASDRLAGATRIETAAAIARRAFPGTARSVYLVNAAAYSDAVVSGAFTDGPILLVPTTGELPAAVAHAIRALAPTTLTAIGGTGSVRDDTLTAARALLGDRPVTPTTPSPSAPPTTGNAPIFSLPVALDWAKGEPISGAGKVANGRTKAQLIGSDQTITIEPRPLAPPQIGPAQEIGTLGMGAAMGRPTEIFTAGSIPSGGVALTRTYAAPLPAGVQPTFAYFDAATGVWTPVKSMLSADRTVLTATVNHLSPWTDVVTGLTPGNVGALIAAGANGADYRAIGEAYSEGAAAPTCSTTLPSWITRDRIDQILDSAAHPVRYCVGADPLSPDDLQVKVAANRAYPVVIHPAVTPAKTSTTSDSAAYLTPATIDAFTRGADSSIGRTLSAGMTAAPSLLVGGHETTLRFTQSQVRSVSTGRPLLAATPVNGVGFVGARVVQRVAAAGPDRAGVANLVATSVLTCGTEAGLNVDDPQDIAASLLTCTDLSEATLTPQITSRLQAADSTLTTTTAATQAAAIARTVTTALTWATAPTPSSVAFKDDLARPTTAYTVTVTP